MEQADRLMWLGIRRGLLCMIPHVENRHVRGGLVIIAGAIAARWGIEDQPSRREHKRQARAAAGG